MAEDILGDATVITLPLQDDGTVIVKQSDHNHRFVGPVGGEAVEVGINLAN